MTQPQKEEFTVKFTVYTVMLPKSFDQFTVGPFDPLEGLGYTRRLNGFTNSLISSPKKYKMPKLYKKVIQPSPFRTALNVVIWISRIKTAYTVSKFVFTWFI